jgi:transposase
MKEQKTLFIISDYPKIDNYEKKYKGMPRTVKPQRDQVEMMMFSIDQLIPADHKARLVWKYVEKLDLSKLLLKIESTQGSLGRPAIDPHVLLTL